MGRTPVRRRSNWLQVALAGIILSSPCPSIWADGGAIQVSERREDLEITVFTAPNPLRVGPVDISVLVLDAQTGQPHLEVEVTVQLVPVGRPGATLSQVATSRAATNKLFRSAIFDVSHSGVFEAEVTVNRGKRSEQVRFRLEVAAPSASWSDLWIWIGWPLLAILLYAVHLRMVWSRLRRNRFARGLMSGQS